MIKKILFGGQRDLSFAANLGSLLLRVFTGLALMFGHGMAKIQDPSGIIGGAGKLGFPMPTFFGWAAALSEFAGAGLLVLGLFTRVSSFFVATTMTVAFIGVHFSDPFEKQEKALLYLFIALLFVLKGAGDWSVDALISKRK